MSARDRLFKVAGYCPMGCGETLFLGDGGHVTCSFVGCPEPCAADTVLHERETEHVVVLTAERFTIQHPLRESVAGELFECPLHDYLSALDGPPIQPGRYRAYRDVAGRWSFFDLGDRPAVAAR